MPKEKKEEIYEKVRKILDSFPIGAPKGREVMKFLKEVLSEEEAKIFIEIPKMPSKATSHEIAMRIGYPTELTGQILKKMANKGVISSYVDQNGYEMFMVVPLMPGILEYFFSGGISDSKILRLSNIISKYVNKDYIHEVHSSEYPFMRVIPINKTIHTESTILPYEEAEYILNQANSIAVINCCCRSLEKKCSAPLETCIMLDSAADYVLRHRNAKKMKKEEGQRLLEETERLGLVHMTINTQSGSSGICNCCRCCCMLLRGLIEYHSPRAFVKSNFMPAINESLCQGCEKCIDICPVGAMSLQTQEKKNRNHKRISLSSQRCIGCGLCASQCPNEVIRLERVRNYIPEKNLKNAWNRFSKEKVH